MYYDEIENKRKLHLHTFPERMRVQFYHLEDL